MWSSAVGTLGNGWCLKGKEFTYWDSFKIDNIQILTFLCKVVRFSCFIYLFSLSQQVSNGAECIMISKKFFLTHCSDALKRRLLVTVKLFLASNWEAQRSNRPMSSANSLLVWAFSFVQDNADFKFRHVWFPFFPRPYRSHHSLGDINKMADTCLCKFVTSLTFTNLSKNPGHVLSLVPPFTLWLCSHYRHHYGIMNFIYPRIYVVAHRG